MRKAIVVVLSVAALVAVAVACDAVKDLLKADPNVPCGRFCIKCSECKGQGTDSTYKQFIDYACQFQDLGIACQEACQKGSEVIPGVDVAKNVGAIEQEKNAKVNEAAFTCDEFSYGVIVGDLTGPCSRFCKKCVECAGKFPSGDSAVSWCAAEDGIVCAKACLSEWVSWVTGFEETAKANSGIQSLDDLNCNDWKATLDKAGQHP